ncbi:MAG: cation:dicarboxylase symporter family transporter [Flavobacteriales bacterium]
MLRFRPSVGIPLDGLIVIIGIDRILGMFRTAVNVSGDLTACLVFERFFGTIPAVKPVGYKAWVAPSS